MRRLLIAAVLGLALLSAACEVTIDGYRYDCQWTPDGVQCVPSTTPSGSVKE